MSFAASALPVSAQTPLHFTPSPKAPGTSYTFTPSASTTASSTQINVQAQMIASLSATINAQTVQLAANQSAINTLTTQRNAVQGQLTSAQQALTTMQAQLDAANAALASSSSAQAQLAAANATVTTLTAQLASANSALTAAQAAAAQTQASLQASLDAANAALATANANGASKDAQIVSLTTQLATANATIAAGGITRVAIAHSIPSNGPYTDQFGNYASLFPLAINTGLDTIYNQIGQCGFDQIEVDAFLNPASVLPGYLSQGDAKGFGVLYCIDTGGEAAGQAQSVTTAKVITAINTYKAEAVGHASAVKIGGKLAVAFYNDGDHVSASGWAQVHAAEPDVAILADVGGAYINNNSAASVASTMATFSSTAASLYTFGPVATAPYLAGISASGLPAAWTVRAGYRRTTGTSISYVDPVGIATFLNAFNAAFTTSLVVNPAQINALYFPTLDDFAEATNLIPDTYWNWTRTDTCACEIAKYKRQPMPISTSRAYSITPQSAYLGQTVQFQVLVINPTASTDLLTATLRNVNGVAVGSGFGGQAAPNSLTLFTKSVTVTSDILSQSLVGGLSNLKIVENLTDAVTGGGIASHESAYSALYTTAAPSGYGQTEYYAVPSNRVLSPRPTGSVNISSAGIITATINYPAGAHIVQLLHDTRRVHAWFDPTSSITNQTLTADNRGQDYRGDGGDHGVWTVEVVMSDGRVGWSDPLTVTHNG